MKIMINGILNDAFQNKKNIDLGLVMHVCYTHLGLICLVEKNLEKSKEELKRSIIIPKSPVIKYFGPTMILADVLIKFKQYEAVKEYFVLSKRYSSALFNIFKLKRWSRELKRKNSPDFGRYKYMHIIKTEEDIKFYDDFLSEL